MQLIWRKKNPVGEWRAGKRFTTYVGESVGVVLDTRKPTCAFADGTYRDTSIDGFA